MNFDQILVERNRREQAIRDSVTMTSMSRHNTRYDYSAIMKALPLENDAENVRTRHSQFTHSPCNRFHSARSSSPTLLIVEHRPCFSTASTFAMGKSDENQTKKSVHRATATGESKHKAADGESNNKNKPGFDTLGIISLDATFENNKIELLRHSRWRDNFQQLCEYKVQFGHCRVPVRYSANPKLGVWARSQRYGRTMEEEKPCYTTDERIRALDAIGFDWGIRRTDLASMWSERVGQLCKFKAQFGHCRVPARYSTNPRLA